MKDDLLDRIKSGSHWTLRILPASGEVAQLGLTESLELVGKHKLSIRGWDFPHISHRNDEHGGTVRDGKFIENWTDWASRQEFWRFYKSGQFIYMERLEEESHPLNSTTNYVDMISAIYTFTEYFVFAERLSGTRAYNGHCKVSVTFNCKSPVQLYAGRNRVPFFDPKIFSGDEIFIERDVLDYGDPYGGKKLAQEAILEFFDYFGWNPDQSMVVSEQEKYFSRNFGA